MGAMIAGHALATGAVLVTDNARRRERHNPAPRVESDLVLLPIACLIGDRRLAWLTLFGNPVAVAPNIDDVSTFACKRIVTDASRRFGCG